MTRLHLGCGSDHWPGWVNVDRIGLPAVDRVTDLDVPPWPFDDESADEIAALDLFEHLDNPLTFMSESWRVLQPGGMLRVRSPHWQSQDAHTDPTHRRAVTEGTFDYWIPGTMLAEKYGDAYAGKCAFEKASVQREGSNLEFWLKRL